MAPHIMRGSEQFNWTAKMRRPELTSIGDDDVDNDFGLALLRTAEI